MPENRKIASMPHRNREKPASRAAADEVSGVSPEIVKAIDARRPRPDTSVQIAPPIRSVRGANSTRAPAPTRGPRKTSAAGSGSV